MMSNGGCLWEIFISSSPCLPESMAPLPLIENHSHTRDLANDIDIGRIGIDHRKTLRSRMRLQNQLAAVQRAPSHHAAPAMFQQVDGTIEFIAPAAVDDLAVALIDQDQRAGL